MKLTAVYEPAKEGGYTCFVEQFPAAMDTTNLTIRPAHLFDVVESVVVRLELGLRL